MENIDKKIKITVDKTIEAIARIERFIDKYADKIAEEDIKRISNKIQELQNKVNIKK